jgi:hypothetical protein
VDEEGDAAPSTNVIVLRQVGSGNSRRLVKVDWTTTNDLGEYRIAALSPGHYFLAADAREPSSGAEEKTSSNGRTADGYVPIFYPGTAEPVAAAPVRVNGGETVSGINIQLCKTRVYSIQGRILAGAGTPRRIQVMLLPKRQDDVAMGLAEMTTMASAEGSFEFHGVQSGSYYLFGVRTEGQAQCLVRTPIEVAGSNLENLLISISEPLEVAGTVRVEGANSVVPRGVVVSLMPSEGLPMIPPSAAVNESGAFHMAGVARDNYRLNIAGLPEGSYVQSVRVGGADALDRSLDLSQVTAVPAIDIVLGEKAGMVEGVVLADGKPAPASVVFIPEPSRPNQPYLYKHTSTDDNGRFKMTGLAPGEYKAYAFDEETTITGQIDADWAPPLEMASDRIAVRRSGREGVELRLMGSQSITQ